MKAISLWQPFATLVIIGAKIFDTRHWRTDYTGPLAIHAAKRTGPDPDLKAICEEEPFKTALAAAGFAYWHQLPLGAILGTVHLDGCYIANSKFVAEDLDDDPRQRAFGDYSAGRFAWRLKDPHPLRSPVSTRGAQGFFNWKPEPFDLTEEIPGICRLCAAEHWVEHGRRSFWTDQACTLCRECSYKWALRQYPPLAGAR